MDLNTLKASVKISAEREEYADISDVAIIGINAKIGQAKDAGEFWEALCEGRDLIRDFPSKRYEDADKIHTILHGGPIKEKITPCAYMDQIDSFNHTLFQLSKTEAEYMNPMQKLFLESAWQAIEDGGYGGGKIKDTNTGIYLGYSGSENPFGEALAIADPEAKGIVVSGNVNSIIASRISYLLNLSGPALLIDTACSSSLAALHIACSQLQSKEVDQALVGGVRVMVLPRMERHNMMGVESASSHARTFDHSADGTGGGEGVICFLLKRTAEAMRDGDHIYAVIKGSAMNQDGTSIGLTAPNDDAQAEVIRTAWKRAKINPYEISYIEAHGTATQLGDPIEISGLNKAFASYTNNKQFCALGAVKTNVGHLDAAAGLAGLLKVILMLKYKKIPPTIGFNVPNQEINFTDSPVYVTDTLRHWSSERKSRLCGVSSFGISGTNCHVILEEAPEKKKDSAKREEDAFLLTISDETKEKLEIRIEEYKKWIIENPDISFADFCYSANFGRHVFGCRFYTCLNSTAEFLDMDYNLTEVHENYGYHEFKDVNPKTAQADLIHNSHDQLSREAQELIAETTCEKGTAKYKQLLREIGEKFILGADVPWLALYRGESRNTLAIPIHSFSRHRCWPKLVDWTGGQRSSKDVLHPLIDEVLVDSYHMRIYHTRFSIKRCWELKEHKINDIHVLVGTAFIEMAHFVAADYWKTNKLMFRNLVFYHALISKADEVTDVQSIVKQEGETLKIGFYSKKSDKWKCYMEVEVKKVEKTTKSSEDINQIKDRCCLIDFNNMPVKSRDHIVKINGVRWSNIESVWKGENELFIKFNLNKSLKKEKNRYYLYPSLLDPAINSGNMLIDDMFLPYSCGHAEFHCQLPDMFYSRIQRKQNQVGEEIGLFNIVFYSESGTIIGHLSDYAIKRVNHIQALLRDHTLKENKVFHRVKWNQLESLTDNDVPSFMSTIVVCRPDQLGGKWIRMLDADKMDIAVAGSDNYEKLTENFVYDRVINLTSIDMEKITEPDQINAHIDQTVKSLFDFIKALLHARVRKSVEIVMLTNNYGRVEARDNHINPLSRALAGMGLCIDHEYDNLDFRLIDIGDEVDDNIILDEILCANDQKIVALRHNDRYSETICESEDIQDNRLALRKNGVYVIAGGLGGMGIAYCRRLCSEDKDIRVVLLNRSYSEQDIKDQIASGRTNCKTGDQLRKLWDEGQNIEIVQCDISDYAALAEVFGRIREKYGRVDGILNAAGVAGDGFIINKTWAEFADVLKPKVSGTLNLHTLTKGDELQFFVMCSSMTSLFGAPGQSDYTAANAFQDGFAEYRKLAGLPALSINWTGWSESGMAVQYEVDTKDKYVHFVGDSEGAQLLYEALSLPDGRILAGEFNYPNLQKQVEKYKGIIMLSEELKIKQSEKSCPIDDSEECGTVDISELIITGKPITSLTTVETCVISSWVRTLQVMEVDINDKFFEMGGNSLLVAYLHKEINKYYPGILSITDLFQHSTISEIAGFIEEKQNVVSTAADEPIEELEDLLDKLVNGEMEIEDVDEQIKIC